MIMDILKALAMKIFIQQYNNKQQKQSNYGVI